MQAAEDICTRTEDPNSCYFFAKQLEYQDRTREAI
jgi:hypothetical protein